MSTSITHTPRRVLAGLLAVALALTGVVLSATVADAQEATRVFGDDRYATSVAVSDATFDSATDVIVARGDGEAFADALAASGVAGAVTAPVLLTDIDEITQGVLDEIEALDPDTVHIAGGTAAVSQDVEDAIADATDADINRFAGENRYDTAALMAAAIGGTNVGELGDLPTAIIARGDNFPDALAGGPIAYAGVHPILLVETDNVPEETTQALTDLGIEQVVILGETAAVSAEVETELVTQVGNDAVRLGGDNRFETAVEIADAATASFGFDTDNVILARADLAADALSGGPHGGEVMSPILLTNSDSLADATETYLTDNAPETITVLGGPAAISDAVVAAAEAAAAAGVVSYLIVGNTPGGTDDGGSLTLSGVADDVEYPASADFAVDGLDATEAVFEDQIDVGDQVEIDDLEDPTSLNLLNTEAPTEGFVGDVTLGVISVIDPVSGTTLATFDIAEAELFTIDGAAATEANFVAALQPGDSVSVSSDDDNTDLADGGTDTFALTNATASGTAVNNDPTAAEIEISQGATLTLGDVTAADNISIDGEDADAADVVAEYSAGDAVSYAATASETTLTLVNAEPTTESGVATEDANTADGFDLVNEDGVVNVPAPGGDARYFVNGLLATATDFGTAYTAGDDVSYTPGDAATDTQETLALQDQDLSGTVGGTIDPTTDVFDVIGPDDATALATITYDLSGDADDDIVTVNGDEVNEATFEGFLGAIDSGILDGTVTVLEDTPESGDRTIAVTTSTAS